MTGYIDLEPNLDPTRPTPMKWSVYEDWVLNQWASLLASQPTEPEVQAFLEQHPSFIPGGLGDVGHGGHHGPVNHGVISQPRLDGVGTLRVPDFMWVTGASDRVTAVMVEIEAPTKLLFRQDNVPTALFTQARNQATQWQVWFREPQNESRFIAAHVPKDRQDQLLTPLAILIFGRQDELDSGRNPRERMRIRALEATPVFEVRSYDRLRPNPKLDSAVCLKYEGGRLVLHAVPPCFSLGPGIRQLAEAVEPNLEVFQRVPLWTPARAQYVYDRWQHWRTIAQPDQQYIETMEVGE